MADNIPVGTWKTAGHRCMADSCGLDSLLALEPTITPILIRGEEQMCRICWERA